MPNPVRNHLFEQAVGYKKLFLVYFKYKCFASKEKILRIKELFINFVSEYNVQSIDSDRFVATLYKCCEKQKALIVGSG